MNYLKEVIRKAREYDYLVESFKTPPKVNENNTMYGLKIYIPFEDLDAYIRDSIEGANKYPTFIPIKAEINELDLGVEISLMSAVPSEFGDRRYKLDLNKLQRENNKCKEQTL